MGNATMGNTTMPIATMRITMGIAGAALAMPLAATARAQTPILAPACTAVAPLPAGLRGFATPVPIRGDTIVVGQAATLALRPGIRFPFTPAKAPAPGGMGGTVAFAVKTAGTYRVALGSGAWIDVVRDGKGVASTRHGHGPTCSPVRKMVDFVLTPGRHVLQLSDAKASSMTVLVAPIR